MPLVSVDGAQQFADRYWIDDRRMVLFLNRRQGTA